MKNLFSLKGRITALLCVLLLAFVITGCQDLNNVIIPGSENNQQNNTEVPVLDALKGTWKSSFGEVFVITESTLSNSGSWGDCYAGDSITVVKTDETSGIIYIKYTRAATASWSYSTDPAEAPDVGKWYAVAYKNLTSNSVELAGAYKAGGKTSTETLEEAKAEFTVANGYFATYSECVKAEVITDDVPVFDALKGTWTSTAGEVFKITDTTLSNGGSWGDCYAGDNLTVVKTDETSGIIYIKYTRAATANWTYSTDPAEAPDIGKWYAVAYKNLALHSVELSGAYKADGKTSTETLEEAKTEFTVANGYFASYSECTK